MRFLGALVLLVVASCGEVTVSTPTPDAPPGPDPGDGSYDGAKSGTRLKLAWNDFGGTRQWSGFHDAMRNEDCELIQWADGNTYCVPSSFDDTAFSDVGCTKQVGRIYKDPSCTTKPPSTYLLDYGNGTCTYSPSHLYQRGAKVAVTQWYSQGSDGTCYGPYDATSYDFYALGTEVATTDLVKVTLGAPQGSARLNPRIYTTDDGFKFPGAIHDAVAGIDCYPSSDYVDAHQGTCIPADAGYANYFRDATCSSGELAIDKSCKAPQYAVSYADQCPTTAGRYFAVGSANTGAPLYFQSDTTCTATTASTTERYYGLGQELVLAPVMRNADAAATGRIVPIHYTWDQSTYRDGMLFDAMLQTECTTYTFPDGTKRCIPSSYGTSTYYTDPACNFASDVVLIYKGGMSCSPPPLPSFAIKYTTDTSGTCQQSYEIHAVTTPYTGALYFKSGTTCYDAGVTDFSIYKIGPTLPLSMFATGTPMSDR